MATAYEVYLTVTPEASATALADVLRRTLRSQHFTRSPTIDETPEDDAALVVSLWLDAGDASEARLAATDAVRRALRDAGLSEGAATIRDSAVRSSA